MESLIIIQYKYSTGALSIEDLVKMVEQNQLSEKEFFEITRKNYQGFRQVHKMDLEKAKGKN